MKADKVMRTTILFAVSENKNIMIFVYHTKKKALFGNLIRNYVKNRQKILKCHPNYCKIKRKLSFEKGSTSCGREIYDWCNDRKCKFTAYDGSDAGDFSCSTISER